MDSFPVCLCLRFALLFGDSLCYYESHDSIHSKRHAPTSGGDLCVFGQCLGQHERCHLGDVYLVLVQLVDDNNIL